MTITRPITAAAVAVLLALVGALILGVDPAAAVTPTCPEFTPYAQTIFSHSTQIDNQFLPLTPGIRTVLDGTVNNDQGQPEAHRVSFTVSDVTKVIQGVRTVAVWDVDLNQSIPGGLVQESELSFWAQDDAGNVWNMAEYPEEFPGGTFAGAPSTWLAGFDEAQPGVHMGPNPTVTTKWSLQGFAPRIDFEDCARVNKLNQTICIPLSQPNNCTTYDNVVVTEEKDAFDPASGIQTKAHAPGIGIIKIGAIGDPLGETLELVRRDQLGADEMAQVRQAVLTLDQRAYTYGGPYVNPPPAEAPVVQQPPPVEQPPVQQPVQQPLIQTPRPGPGNTPQPLTLSGLARQVDGPTGAEPAPAPLAHREREVQERLQDARELHVRRDDEARLARDRDGRRHPARRGGARALQHHRQGREGRVPPGSQQQLHAALRLEKSMTDAAAG